MDILYAPWRETYDQAEKKKDINEEECVFCLRIKGKKDKDEFILKRALSSIVILNHYPYNAGHIMVIPVEHVARLDQLTPEVRAELIEEVSNCQVILEQALNAKGFNTGINSGLTGGGGIPSHLHIHVLPRFPGDTTFIETISQTKLISRDLLKIYELLKSFF